MNVSPRPPVTLSGQWNTCFVGNSSFAGNMLVMPANGNTKLLSTLPVGNATNPDFPSLFVNFNGGNGGDYHVSYNSSFVGGANVDLVNLYTAGVK